MTTIQLAIADATGIEVVCVQCRKQWLGGYYGIELCNKCRCEAYGCVYAVAEELLNAQSEGRYCEEHYWNFTHVE